MVGRHMSKRTIFISCGQYTPEEKALGKAIVKMVDDLPGMKAYFAEEVQDLIGLDSNILAKLHECDGFITVLHPRGDIKRPEGLVITRASVWIEQEIAIAAYIRQTEKRALPVIAFKHRSVGLEGIRGLVQLNPVEFTHEMEVLAALPALLEGWKALAPTGIRPEIRTTLPIRHQDGHPIRQLLFRVVNDSGSRIREISGELRVPAGILKHWSNTYGMDNAVTEDGRYRVFRFDERNVGAIQPRTTGHISTFEYCIPCAIKDTGEISEVIGAAVVADYVVEITIWVDGREYRSAKTMKELSIVAGGGQQRGLELKP
jgi:hypothetical protein